MAEKTMLLLELAKMLAILFLLYASQRMRRTIAELERENKTLRKMASIYRSALRESATEEPGFSRGRDASAAPRTSRARGGVMAETRDMPAGRERRKTTNVTKRGEPKMRRITVLGILVAVAGCTAVDETEHCVETRYGQVVNEEMGNGLNLTVLTSATCFPTTEQNHTLQNVEVRTNDPVTLTVEGITVVWEYPENLYAAVFLDKRSHDKAFVEIEKGIEQGIKDTFIRHSFAEVNGPKFSELPGQMRVDIQRAVGGKAVVKNVLLSGKLTGPPSVEAERVRTMEQNQALQTALAAARTDSINNARLLAAENVNAQVKELSARAYASNPDLLKLEIARELKSVCSGAQTCILGGSTIDAIGLGR